MGIVLIQPGVLYWWKRGAMTVGPIWLPVEEGKPPRLQTDTELHLLVYYQNVGAALRYVLPVAFGTKPLSGRGFTLSTPGAETIPLPAGQSSSYAFGPLLLDEPGDWYVGFIIYEATTPTGDVTDSQLSPMLVASAFDVEAPPAEAPSPIPVLLGGVAILGILAAAIAANQQRRRT